MAAFTHIEEPPQAARAAAAAKEWMTPPLGADAARHLKNRPASPQALYYVSASYCVTNTSCSYAVKCLETSSKDPKRDQPAPWDCLRPI
jgi:hypothetical protein